MRARSLVLSLLCCVTLSLLACSSGGGSSGGNSVTNGMPCDDITFDVWRASFVPMNADHISIAVDLNQPNHAAQFRLTVACQGLLIDESTPGCTVVTPDPDDVSPPPSLSCKVPLPNGLSSLSRATCLIEIFPMDQCAAAGGDNIANYRLTVMVGNNVITPTLAADNCIATDSCLATFFAINVTPNATVTPGPPTPTATPNP